RELRLTPYTLSRYVQFNVKRKPFDDLHVRMALSLAIDREILCSRVERAGEQPAYALIPPGMPEYPMTAQTDFKLTAMKQRVTKAKELLTKAGFGPNNPLTFDFA